MFYDINSISRPFLLDVIFCFFNILMVWISSAMRSVVINFLDMGASCAATHITKGLCIKF